VGERVGRIGELVGIEPAVLGCQPFGDVLVVFVVSLAHVGTRRAHVRAQGLEVKDLFLGHLVGDHDDELVALLGRHQRERQAGVAGGRLDDRAAGPSRPSASAASIMDLPMRSLIEPPGLRSSSFRNSRQGPVSMRVTSCIGVLPMASSTVE
jgi:hypothetical protein